MRRIMAGGKWRVNVKQMPEKLKTEAMCTTGRGTPYGLAAVPVIKVSSRTDLYRRWPDLIDVDAGTIATGESTIEKKGWELFNLYIEVASGRKKTWAQHWGISNGIAIFHPGSCT